MAKLTKNRKAVIAKYNQEKVYSLEEAAKVLKDISFTKFDASVDVDIRPRC
jgi:large subunit ribosomal protein L1